MATYTNPTIDQEVSPKQVFYPDNKVAIFTCNGSPEGVILANTGSIALSDNGSVYKKTTDNVNTGWIELQSGAITSPAVITGTNPTLTFDDTTGGESDGSISVDANVLSLSIVGGTAVQLKSNGQFIGIPRHLAINVTQVGNVGAGLDALQSIVIPTNSLAANNDYIDVIQSGVYANTATSKRLVSTIDGQTIHDTGLIAIGNAGSGAGWICLTRIIRISATTVRCIFQINVGNVQFIQAATTIVATAGGTKNALQPLLTVANLNANPITLLMSGEATNTDDIVQNSTSATLTQLS